MAQQHPTVFFTGSQFACSGIPLHLDESVGREMLLGRSDHFTKCCVQEHVEAQYAHHHTHRMLHLSVGVLRLVMCWNLDEAQERKAWRGGVPLQFHQTSSSADAPDIVIDAPTVGPDDEGAPVYPHHTCGREVQEDLLVDHDHGE